MPAGSGITIIEAKVWWQASHQIGGADTFGIAADNDGAVGESTTPITGSEPSTYVLPSTTTEITLANYCSNDDAGAGCTFGSGENNILELYGSRLTLQDATLPSGAVTGGALAAGDGFGHVLDQLPGGGHELGRPAGAAARRRRTRRRQGLPGELLLHELPGVPAERVGHRELEHCHGGQRPARVELVVEDAAQNTSVIYSGEVTVQNTTQTASLGALPGPGGTGSQALGIGSANGIGHASKRS